MEMNTKIIIKDSNRDRLQAVLDQAQGRCTARTIDVDDLFDAVRDIEERLRIPHSAMNGIRAFVDMHAQKFPAAYKWIPYSTQFELRRFPSGWGLVHVERDICNAPSKTYRLILTDAAVKAVLKTNTVFC